jgi:hypothetical protein
MVVWSRLNDSKANRIWEGILCNRGGTNVGCATVVSVVSVVTDKTQGKERAGESDSFVSIVAVSEAHLGDV